MTALLALIAAAAVATTDAAPAPRQSYPVAATFWRSAYYSSIWHRLPPAEIDFELFTHVFHASLQVRPDGSLDAAAENVTADESRAIVAAGHVAGAKVLVTVAGGETLVAATTGAKLDRLVANLVAFMQDRGYDGIDLDWEPLDGGPNSAGFARLVPALRAALDRVSPRPLLTAAIGVREPAQYARVHGHLDQLNVMTYDLAGSWGPGRGSTWHHAALFNAAGARDPLSLSRQNSADDFVRALVAAGVPRAKLGVGLPFFGYVWQGSGVTKPNQSFLVAPAFRQVSYADVVESYLRPEYARWDDAAKAPYLSVDTSGPRGAMFVTYEDPRSIAEKVRYAREHGHGGVMVFILGMDRLPGRPIAERYPLVNAVREAIAAP